MYVGSFCRAQSLVRPGMIHDHAATLHALQVRAGHAACGAGALAPADPRTIAQHFTEVRAARLAVIGCRLGFRQVGTQPLRACTASAISSWCAAAAVLHTPSDDSCWRGHGARGRQDGSRCSSHLAGERLPSLDSCACRLLRGGPISVPMAQHGGVDGVGSAQKRLDATAESGPVSYGGRHRLFPLEPAIPDAPDSPAAVDQTLLPHHYPSRAGKSADDEHGVLMISSYQLYSYICPTVHGIIALTWNTSLRIQPPSRIRSAKSGTGNGPDPSSGLDKCACACAPCSPQGLCSAPGAHRCACSLCALGFVQCLPSSTRTTSSVEHSTTQSLPSAHHQSRTRI
jgi:hypothetical protein